MQEEWFAAQKAPCCFDVPRRVSHPRAFQLAERHIIRGHQSKSEADAYEVIPDKTDAVVGRLALVSLEHSHPEIGNHRTVVPRHIELRAAAAHRRLTPPGR